jgi:17beta-estradiol 17-dehydrogenase / very-long-chain 3-oxoacyl-CoA reductase
VLSSDPSAQAPTSWEEYRGSWAIVTGASDGIGSAYARALAARGLNVVIMARTQAKLEALAKEITAEYKVAGCLCVLLGFVCSHRPCCSALQVQVRPVPFDFSQPLAAYEAIPKAVDDIKVRVLVNNVGGRYGQCVCCVPRMR